MTDNSQTVKNEINLFEFLKSFWDGKIIIILITVLSLIIGAGYNYLLPEPINKFKYSLKIKSSGNSEFLKFVPIYNFLNTTEPDLRGINLTGLKDFPDSGPPVILNQPKLLNEKILDKFIRELMDFEELILILKTNNKIATNIRKFSTDDQEKVLFDYVKTFTINEPKKGEINHVLNFLWKDDEDLGPEILEKTLKLTLENMINSFYKELDDLLEIKINAIINQDKRKVAYLLEQSAIAKKLNISDNQVDRIDVQSNLSFRFNIIDAYYLRGYKAIDMEIALIEGRKYEFFQYLKKELEKIKLQKTRWIDYNMYLLEKNLLEDHENTPINLIILLVAGLLAGMLFVIILNAFKSQINHRKKTK